MDGSGLLGRVDLHTHVLPGIDDGARDDAEALAMLRVAAADGSGVLVATPHGAFANRERVVAAARRLDGLATLAGIPVRILPGSEQRLTADLPNRLADGEAATIGGTPWVLVELALEQSWPAWFDQAIYRVQLAGFWPILAHPERYPPVQRNPWLLSGAVGAGVLMQVNAAAFLARPSSRSRHTAEQLLRLSLVHLLASDAHSAAERPPVLADAFARVAELAGPDIADDIAANAARVVNGEAVTPALPLAPDDLPPAGVRGLLRRLFHG